MTTCQIIAERGERVVVAVVLWEKLYKNVKRFFKFEFEIETFRKKYLINDIPQQELLKGFVHNTGRSKTGYMTRNRKKTS